MTGKQTPTRSAALLRVRTRHRQSTRTTPPTRPADADVATVDETRRSGRANKGQHTKNLDLVEEAAAPKPAMPLKAGKKGQPKGKGDVGRAQSSQSADQDDEEDDAIIRCV